MNCLKYCLFFSVFITGCSRQFVPGVYQHRFHAQYDFRPDGTYYYKQINTRMGELNEWSVGQYKFLKNDRIVWMTDSLYRNYAIPISVEVVRNDLPDTSRTLYFDQRLDTRAWKVVVNDSFILRINDYKVEIPAGVHFDHFYMYCYDEVLFSATQQIVKTKVYYPTDSGYNKYYVQIPDYALSYDIVSYQAPRCPALKIKRKKLVHGYCNGVEKTIYKLVEEY